MKRWELFKRKKKKGFCGLKQSDNVHIRAHVEGHERPGKYPGKSCVIWWAFSKPEWVFSKCSITCLTIFWVLLSTGRAERYFFFFFLISAVHQRFYLNCSYKKLMKALSCWATKWQEWIPVRWNLLKIQLSKRSCVNTFLRETVHTHLQYRPRPGGGEFCANLLIMWNKARTRHSSILKGTDCLWSTDEAERKNWHHITI